jgi:hypothetical protein
MKIRREREVLKMLINIFGHAGKVKRLYRHFFRDVGKRLFLAIPQSKFPVGASSRVKFLNQVQDRPGQASRDAHIVCFMERQRKMKDWFF